MAEINVGGISEALNNKSDIDLNNLNGTGAEKFDGEWTYLTNYIRIFEAVTPPVDGAVLTYDLSTYLPSDGAIYECFLNGMCFTGKQSGDTIGLFLATDLIPEPTTNFVVVCAIKTKTSSDLYNRSSSILAVGTGRTLILVGSTNNRNGNVTCDLIAYRRLGKTN